MMDDLALHRAEYVTRRTADVVLVKPQADPGEQWPRYGAADAGIERD
jgi:hypothetical protein